MPNRSNYCLLGIADHQGVQNVGGRIGSALAPAAFRAQFNKIQSRHPVLENIVDLGNVEPTTMEVRDTLEKATETLALVHCLPNRRSVVIGGGHDHGYSQLAGVKRGLERLTKGHQLTKTKIQLGCINIDAHLDVRAVQRDAPILSGSPFYLAIEDQTVATQHLIEFGIQPQCNSKELWDYVEQKRIRVIEWSELRHGKGPEVFSRSLELLAHTCDAIVISLDLDALAQCYAPGVSAPQAEGFTSSDILSMIEIAAGHHKVVSLGIFELNPLHDRDEQTARLAANIAHRFFSKVIFHQ